MNTSAKSTRRDLLVAAARTACIATLGAFAVLLTLRNGRVACGARTGCSSCRRRDGCDLAADTEQVGSKPVGPEQADSARGESPPR